MSVGTKTAMLTAVVAMLMVPAGASGSGRKVFRVSGPAVMLKEVCGQDLGEFGEVEIGTAPPPGVTAVLDREEILDIAAAAGVRNAESLRLPKKVRIKRLSKTPSEKEFAGKVRSAVIEALPGDMKLQKMGRLVPTEVPVSGWSAAASFPASEIRAGRETVSVSLYSNGEVFHRFKVTVLLQVERLLPVASRRLEAGQRITRQDIEYVDAVRVARPGLYQADGEDVIGMLLKKPLAPGRPFPKSILEPENVVERNDSVSVRSLSGGVVVVARGVARQQGAVGDRIQVLVASSNRVVMGVVTGPKQVRLL